MKNQIVHSWVALDQMEIRNNNQQPTNKLANQNEKLLGLKNRLENSIKTIEIRYSDNLTFIEKQLQNLNPLKVLDRGYSLAFDKENQIIRFSNQIPIGGLFSLKTSDGSFEAKKMSDDSDN